MATSKMFVHYSGTVDQFKALSNIAEYNNKIVFIKGGNDGKGAAIYTHGKYYANLPEIEGLISKLPTIVGVQANGDISTKKVATEQGQVINFSSDNNELVMVTTDPTGIKINAGDGIKDAVTKKHWHDNKPELDKIVDGDKAKWDASVVNLGSKSDAASSGADASAFARIASLTESVSALTSGGTGSIANQIDSLRKEINGTLATDDATTLEAINDELDAIQANYIAKSDLATEASDNDGVNVKVTVKTKDGKVSDVIVDESALTAAFNLKANAADVYDKTGAENMAQGKVNALANGAVKDNTDAIRILNGSDTGKSAREIVQDEVSRQLNSENISDSFDTLKEMAEWLSSHPKDVTDMQNSIQHILNDYLNSSDKEEIQNIIIENERVTAETYNDLDDRLIALEGKNSTIDSALQEIIAVGSDYITLTDSNKTNNTQTINASVAVQAVSAATASKQGLADAYDVNQEIAAARTHAETYADGLFDWEEF